MSDIFSAGGAMITVYPTPKNLQDKVEEYFETCFVMKYDSKIGMDRPYELHPPTYSGLARYLGFNSRWQLLRYCNENDERYTDIIKNACLRLEDYLEGKLVYSKAPAGIMFALKNNAGWEDKSKQQITGNDDKPLVFAWSDRAGDVIDAESVAVPKEGVLPPGVGEIGGAIRRGGDNRG